jgi:amidase
MAPPGPDAGFLFLLFMRARCRPPDGAARLAMNLRPDRFTAALVLALAAGAAQPASHTFAAKTYYTTFSGAHPVALTIKPGDRVSTKTIDAAGADWNGVTVAGRGNPETGPFYIEGAEPGDMLVVHLESIVPNRATAFSGSLLAPYTVDPITIAERVDREPKRVIWLIDRDKGRARLEDTTIQAGNIELPLNPMLGCIGVAPDRKQAIATNTPGNFGGNMDMGLLPLAGVAAAEVVWAVQRTRSGHMCNELRRQP